MSTVKVMPSFVIKLMNLSRELSAEKREILADSLSKIATPIFDERTVSKLQKKLGNTDDTAGRIYQRDDGGEVFGTAKINTASDLTNFVQLLLESPKYSSFPAKKVMPLLKTLKNKLSTTGTLTSQSISGTLDFYMGNVSAKQKYEEYFFSKFPEEDSPNFSKDVSEESETEHVFGDKPGEKSDEYELDENFIHPGLRLDDLSR